MAHSTATTSHWSRRQLGSSGEVRIVTTALTVEDGGQGILVISEAGVPVLNVTKSGQDWCPSVPLVPLNIARGAGQLILYQRC